MPPKVLRRTLALAGFDVPVIELTGSGGPRLTVLAGVHGCEYAPMAAVRHWTRALAGRELRGSVRAVPVLNLPAFRARSPFVVPDDGKNLNRCFPGDPSGTVADRLAHAAFTQLIEGSDALVDAHAGDMVEALEPFALYDAGASEDRASELAAAYGLDYVIRQQPGPGRAVGRVPQIYAVASGRMKGDGEAGGGSQGGGGVHSGAHAPPVFSGEPIAPAMTGAPTDSRRQDRLGRARPTCTTRRFPDESGYA